MAEKVKKTIPWFLFLCLLFFACAGIFNFMGAPADFSAQADVVSTSVTVGNSGPTLVAVYENPESVASSPTNVGSDVVFAGRADDPNGEDWYLLICKGTDYATSSAGSCPTCTAGAWATSTAADNATATATYTALSGDSESNAWYAYVCDNNVGGQKCSEVSQGNGPSDSNSPFVVNHRPGFTLQANTGPIEPGASVSFFASSTDADSGDTIKFVVCKTSGLSGTECNGGSSDTWCTTTAAADPNCSATADDPAEGAQNYYPYIFDSHSFASDDALQASAQSYTVSNVAPSISNVTLNGGSDINLTSGGEGPTGSTTVFATADVVDHNGCSDVSSVTVSAYPTGVGFSSCTSQDDNSCYYNVSCQVGTCQGNGYTATTSCNINFWYHADPTDSGSPRDGETWKDTITAQDEALSGSSELSTGVELLSYMALDVSSQIAYGTLGAGEISSTTSLPVNATTTNTGNTGLDVELSGSSMCSDYPTCEEDTIGVAYQKYATSSVQYQNATALSESPTETELDCQKTTTTDSPKEKANYWGLQIPLGTPPGSYTGANTYTAARSESTQW